jgi:hypothetical protein
MMIDDRFGAGPALVAANGATTTATRQLMRGRPRYRCEWGHGPGVPPASPKSVLRPALRCLGSSKNPNPKQETSRALLAGRCASCFSAPEALGQAGAKATGAS